MLLRSMLRVSAAVALAFLVSPGAPAAAPPTGLAYDEIVRVVMGAPPPPGAFQADVAGLEAPGATSNQTISGATDEAMRRALGPALGGLAAAAHAFWRPRLLRYAYWNGWERIDDPAAQTATIRKCDLGQVFKLDLAARTYAVFVPGAEPSPEPAVTAPHHGRQSPPPDPRQPGTAVATVSEATTTLPAQRIEDYPTSGYDSSMSFALTQATGSCRDGAASLETVQYLTALFRPVVNGCPIRRAPLPLTASEVVTPTAEDGCRPSFTAGRTGSTPPSSRFALYSLVLVSPGTTTTAPNPTPAPFGFLTERGNLRPLGPADAEQFGPPAGFKKTP